LRGSEHCISETRDNVSQTFASRLCVYWKYRAYRDVYTLEHHLSAKHMISSMVYLKMLTVCCT